MRIENWHPDEVKGKWRVVRTDNYANVPGAIITADEETGEVTLQDGNVVRQLSFGPRGCKLVQKK